MRAALVIAALLLVGCAQPLVKPMDLDRPARPTLPTVKASELQCLDPDTYRRLVRREQIRRDYCEKLETTIDAARGNDER